MRETWYILEDGTPADPKEVGPDQHGVLRHKNGVAVAIGPHGPRSTGVDVAQQRATREMVSDEPKRTYKTRESKVR